MTGFEMRPGRRNLKRTWNGGVGKWREAPVRLRGLNSLNLAVLTDTWACAKGRFCFPGHVVSGRNASCCPESTGARQSLDRRIAKCRRNTDT